MNELVYIFIHEKMGRLHVFLPPLRPQIAAQKLVVLLQDLPESSVVQSLVILQQNQTEVKLAERQLQFLYLPGRFLVIHLPEPGHLPVAQRVQRRLQLAVQRGELPGGLGQLLRVERVDLLELLIAIVEELLVEVPEVPGDDLCFDALC